jgi:hypothetical protein
LAGLRPLQIRDQGTARIVGNRGDGAAGRTEAKAMERQCCRFSATRSQTNLRFSTASQLCSSNVAKISR